MVEKSMQHRKSTGCRKRAPGMNRPHLFQQLVSKYTLLSQVHEIVLPRDFLPLHLDLLTPDRPFLHPLDPGQKARQQLRRSEPRQQDLRVARRVEAQAVGLAVGRRGLKSLTLVALKAHLGYRLG